MKLKKLFLATGATALTFAATTATAATDFSDETQAYKSFVISQVDLLLEDTEKFAAALKKGNVTEAKRLYALSRMYYERSEPIAESFGELDPKIDARLADLTEEQKEAGKKGNAATAAAEAVWTGFHKIEKVLADTNSTAGTEVVAAQLIRDIKELRAKVPTVDVTPELMIAGAVDLLNEVSTSKITGEENIFLKTDLYDFKANVQGAEKIFELFQPALLAKNAGLAAEIRTQFSAVNRLLKKYNQSDDHGYRYIPYDDLTKADIKILAEAVNKLGEPLAQMGIVLEK